MNYSTVYGLSLAVASLSAEKQDFLFLLYVYPKIPHRGHKIPPLDSILRQLSVAHIFTTQFSKTHTYE
jgi:hypothetical protein